MPSTRAFKQLQIVTWNCPPTRLQQDTEVNTCYLFQSLFKYEVNKIISLCSISQILSTGPGRTGSLYELPHMPTPVFGDAF